MPVYEYQCPRCGNHLAISMTIQEYERATAELSLEEEYRQLDEGLPPRTTLPPLCFHGGTGVGNTVMRRIFSFSKPPAFEEHFNLTTGTVTSSARAHANELKRMSEEASARTGMPHNFVPVHPSEAREAYGITDEGLDSTYRKEVETGQREVKQWL